MRARNPSPAAAGEGGARKRRMRALLPAFTRVVPSPGLWPPSPARRERELRGALFMNWIERLARLGYISVGAVYVIIGGITAAAALHGGQRTPDRRDAFFFIIEKPFGHLLLLIIAAGLIGYALWRLSSGFFDSDRRGSDAK